MTIVTKNGDGGLTALRYGRPVPKGDVRVEAYGTVDELGSAMGFAKALLRSDPATSVYGELLHTVQSQLLSVGADLATTAEDHAAKGKPQFQSVYLDWLDSEVAQLENVVKVSGFVLPGVNAASAAVHVSRTVARRAEREVLRLLDVEDSAQVRCMLPYLNRLSDFLWLLGERLAQR